MTKVNTRLQAELHELGPGEWVSQRDLGQNTFMDVALTKDEHDAIIESQGGQSFWGMHGSSSVLTAWSSSAFDEKSNKLFFFGGGHNAYGGNEVYAYDLDAMQWSRLTEPWPLTGEEMSPNNDFANPAPANGPYARHTYDGWTWHPGTETAWLTNINTGFTNSGPLPLQKTIWEFDPEAKDWTAHDLPDSGNVTQKSYYVSSTFNPKTNELVIENSTYGEAFSIASTGSIESVGSQGDKRLGNLRSNPENGKIYTVRKGDLLSVEQNESGDLVYETVADIPSLVAGGKEHFTSQRVGFDFHEPSGRLVLWGGDENVYTFDPDTDVFRVFDAEENAVGPSSQSTRIYGKFNYIEEVDAFAGIADAAGDMWFYKLPEPSEGTVIDPDAKRAAVEHPDGDVTKYETVRKALESAPDGAEVTFLKANGLETYSEAAVITADNLTIEGNGLHLADATTNGKATFVVKGNNTTIKNLEVSGATVGDRNGAPVRLEGDGLRLENVNFHDNQNGLLGGGGAVEILDSTFTANGYGGRAHGIYVSDESEKLTIRNSEFLASKGEGHEIKSRARETVIEDSTVASLDGVDSRLVDVPNGGKLVIRNSVLQEGSNSSNLEMIGYGKEVSKMDSVFPEREITIENNIVLDDSRKSDTRWLDLDGLVSDTSVNADGNVFVGGSNVTAQYFVDGSPTGTSSGDNRFFFSRADAGLEAAPTLPGSIDAVTASGLDTDAPEVVNNQSPEASADAFATSLGQSVSFSARDLLGNDGDPDGDALEIVEIGDTANGTLVRGDDGTLTYTPDDGFFGEDGAVYTVTDGIGGFSEARIELDVQNKIGGRLVINGSENRDRIDLQDHTQAHDIRAGDGPDIITGSQGDDRIKGGPHTDDMAGAGGDDIFVYDGQDNGAEFWPTGGPGSDTIRGSDGDDRMRFKGDFAGSIERIEGGEGRDVIQGWKWPQQWDFSETQVSGIELIDGHSQTGIVGSSADDTVRGSGSDGRRIDGGDGHDTVVYDEPFGAFSFTSNADGSFTVEGPVTNTLENVEVLRFSDGERLSRDIVSGPSEPDGGGNTAPVASADSAATTEGRSVTINVLANDSDPDGDSLSVTGVSGVSDGQATANGDGTVTYTPDAGFAGAASFSYTVADGEGGSATGNVDVTVEALPDAVMKFDADTVADRLNDGDAVAAWQDQALDNDAVQVASSRQPELVEGSGGSAVRFDGQDDVLRIDNSDSLNVGGPYEAKTLAFSLRPGEDVDSRQVIYEQGGAWRGINVYLENGQVHASAWNSHDGTWGPFTLSGSVTSGSVHTLTLGFDASAGTFEAHLDGQSLGTRDGVGMLDDHEDDIGLGALASDSVFADGEVISDGVDYHFEGDVLGVQAFNAALADSERAAVETALGDRNMAPVASADSATTVEDSSVTVDVLANDSDADGDSLSVSGITDVSEGQATANGDGTVTYTPDGDFSGTESFSYTVADGQGGTATGNVDVTVEALPDPVLKFDADTVGNRSNDGDAVAAWQDQALDNDAVQAASGRQPELVEGSGGSAVRFDGQDDVLRIDNSESLNVGDSYDAKTLAFSFRPGDDVDSRQVLYEQGGAWRGINVYLENGQVHASAWNSHDGTWGPFTLSGSVTSGSVHTLTLGFDASAGTFEAHLDGQSLGTRDGVGMLDDHEDDIGLGALASDSVFADGEVISDGVDYHFEGDVLGVQAFNDIVGEDLSLHGLAPETDDFIS